MGLFSFLFGRKAEEPQPEEAQVSTESDDEALLRAKALMAMFRDPSIDNEKATQEDIEAYVHAYIERAKQPLVAETFRRSGDMFTVAGANKRGDLSAYVTDDYKLGFPCQLIEEPYNEYDPDAIRIEITQTGQHVGYVSRDDQEAVREICEGAFPYDTHVTIQEREDEDGRTFYYARYWV